MRYFPISLFLAGLCFLSTDVQAQQRPDSHELLPGVIDRQAAERRLADRFHISAEKNPLGLLEALLKNPERYGIDLKDVEKIAREFAKKPQDLGINLNDPKMQEMARRLAEKAKLDPGQLETIKRILPNLKPPAPVKPDDSGKKPDPDKPADMSKRPDPDKPADMSKRPDIKPPEMGNMPPGMNPGIPGRPLDPVIKPEPTPENESRSWIERQFDNLMDEGGLTSGLHDMFRDLTGPGSFLGDATRGLTDDLKQLGGKLFPDFEGIQIDGIMHDIQISAPQLDFSFSGPSMSGSSLPSAGTFGSVFVVIFLIGVVGLALLLLVRSRGWTPGAGGDGWRLGPWPVAPGAVRTRDDLVKAFEYLALLLLGRKVSSANHLDIAGQLGANDSSERRGQAAGELAELYEHARYAPPDEALSDVEMESARRDLTFLAGAATA